MPYCPGDAVLPFCRFTRYFCLSSCANLWLTNMGFVCATDGAPYCPGSGRGPSGGFGSGWCCGNLGLLASLVGTGCASFKLSVGASRKLRYVELDRKLGVSMETVHVLSGPVRGPLASS